MTWTRCPYKTVKIVKHQGKYYIWYKTDDSGYAQLIDANGNKVHSTLAPIELVLTRIIYCQEFENHWYFITKIGCFSLSTGNRITQSQVLQHFQIKRR